MTAGSTTIEPSVPAAETRAAERLLDRTAQPFAAIDFEGRFVRVNPAFERLDRLSRRGTGGPDARRRSRPSAGTSWGRRSATQVRATGLSARYEKEYRRKDGTLVPVEVLADLDRDEQGEPSGFTAFVTDISERKQVESALRESEERFRRLYDEAPVGYHEIDTEGRIVNINQTECEMLGYAREEMHRPARLRLRRAGDSRAGPRGVRREDPRATRPLHTIERTLVRPATAAACRRDRGAVQARRRRGGSSASGARCRTSPSGSGPRRRWSPRNGGRGSSSRGSRTPSSSTTLDGRILDANPAASRLLGYSREELLSMHDPATSTSPSSPPGYEDRLKSQLDQRTPLLRGAAPDQGRPGHPGRHQHLDDPCSTTSWPCWPSSATSPSARPWRRPAGSSPRRRCATPRRWRPRTATLTESEARYRAAHRGVPRRRDRRRRAGQITLFNPAAETDLRLPRRARSSGSRSTASSPTSSARRAETGSEAVRRRERRAQDRRQDGRARRPPQGRRGVSRSSSRSARSRPGRRAAVHRLDPRPDRAAADAGHARPVGEAGVDRPAQRRRGARDQQSRSPTSATTWPCSSATSRASSQMMDLYEQARRVLEPAAPDLLRKIDDAERGARLGLCPRQPPSDARPDPRGRAAGRQHRPEPPRAWRRTSPPKMETVLIPDLIESALEMIRGRMRRRQHRDVKVEHAPDVPRLTCVASQISQVILNLLINAVQAIEATGNAQGGRDPSSRPRRVGDSVLIAIADNGCGIEPEALPQLFDPFFTTKPVGEGTGLGLSISHGIVTGHGGRIEVESQPGDGTWFRVYLPLKLRPDRQLDTIRTGPIRPIGARGVESTSNAAHQVMPPDHRRRAQRLRLGPRPAPPRVPRPQGAQRRGGFPADAGGGSPHHHDRPADAPDHRGRAADQGQGRSTRRPSGCSSPASPTWSRSSPRSTRGTSSVPQEALAARGARSAVRQAAAEYDR